MIERVHEHIINELNINTRTDTIFILTAIGKGARYAVLYFLYSGLIQVI